MHLDADDRDARLTDSAVDPVGTLRALDWGTDRLYRHRHGRSTLYYLKRALEGIHKVDVRLRGYRVSWIE